MGARDWERDGWMYRETQHDAIRVVVTQRAETVIFLLAGGVPDGELDLLAVDVDIMDVVFEDGGLAAGVRLSRSGPRRR